MLSLQTAGTDSLSSFSSNRTAAAAAAAEVAAATGTAYWLGSSELSSTGRSEAAPADAIQSAEATTAAAAAAAAPALEVAAASRTADADAAAAATEIDLSEEGIPPPALDSCQNKADVDFLSSRELMHATRNLLDGRDTDAGADEDEDAEAERAVEQLLVDLPPSRLHCQDVAWVVLERCDAGECAAATSGRAAGAASVAAGNATSVAAARVRRTTATGAWAGRVGGEVAAAASYWPADASSAPHSQSAAAAWGLPPPSSGGRAAWGDSDTCRVEPQTLIRALGPVI